MAKAKTTGKTTRRATKTENSKKTATKSAAKKATRPAATKTKSAAAKPKPKPKPSKPVAARKHEPSKTAAEVTIDRRAKAGGRRKDTDRRKKAEPVVVERRSIERRAKVSRRRQIDPTTCERDYTDEELEFMNAMDDYKRSSGRMFPTCSEVLEVIRGLGYEKCREETDIANEQTDEQPAEPSADLPTGQPAGQVAESRADWRAEQTLGQFETKKIGLTDGGHSIDPMHASLPLDLRESDPSERVVF